MRYIVLCILSLLIYSSISAQELEPRSLTNLPMGTNFVLAGYRYTQGDILLDPAVPLKDLDARLHSVFAAYVRSIKLFGQTGKISTIIPYADGYWEGTYLGIDSSTQRSGMGDPRINFAWNFIGSPALAVAEYRDFEQKTIVGVNFTTIIPLGQYNPNKLLNLGSNRWTFKAQVGVSQRVKKWFFEAYASIWLFTKNTSYFPDNTLEQYPLLAGKVHVIYSLPKQMWIAADYGYGYGGRTVIEGIEMDTRISTSRFGLTYVLPIAQKHALKFIAEAGRRFDKGPDFNSFLVAYQYRWFDK